MNSGMLMLIGLVLGMLFLAIGSRRLPSSVWSLRILGPLGLLMSGVEIATLVRQYWAWPIATAAVLLALTLVGWLTKPLGRANSVKFRVIVNVLGFIFLWALTVHDSVLLTAFGPGSEIARFSFKPIFLITPLCMLILGGGYRDMSPKMSKSGELLYPRF